MRDYGTNLLWYDDLIDMYMLSTSAPPPQEILKLSMVIIVVPSILAIYVSGHKYVSAVWKVCPRLRQKQSERISIQNSRHACLCAHEHAFTCYYHPATILLPPQLKIQLKCDYYYSFSNSSFSFLSDNNKSFYECTLFSSWITEQDKLLSPVGNHSTSIVVFLVS